MDHAGAGDTRGAGSDPVGAQLGREPEGGNERSLTATYLLACLLTHLLTYLLAY